MKRFVATVVGVVLFLGVTGVTQVSAQSASYSSSLDGREATGDGGAAQGVASPFPTDTVVSAISAAAPPLVPPAIEPVLPAATARQEWEAHRRRQWMALTAVQHGAAAFDAWSTRRSVQAGAHEMNPLLRPVAGSHAVHGAIHLTPLLTDYLGRRMATSEKRWLRRLWWLPQTASTTVHVLAGVNNLGTYREMTR